MTGDRSLILYNNPQNYLGLQVAKLKYSWTFNFGSEQR